MVVCYKCGKKPAKYVVYTPVMGFEYFLCEECHGRYRKEVEYHVRMHCEG